MLSAKIGSLDFDDLRVANDSQSSEDLPQSFGGGGLAGPRRTHQQHVIGLVGHRHPMGQTQGPDLHLVLQLSDGPLHLCQPDLVVEEGATLGQQFRSPLSIGLFGPRAGWCCAARVPPVGATLDGFLVGDNQLKARVT